MFARAGLRSFYAVRPKSTGLLLILFVDYVPTNFRRYYDIVEGARTVLLNRASPVNMVNVNAACFIAVGSYFKLSI
ncbi:MAG: hypothetical protein IJ563_10385 [Selenomonadaceae bacterium]|nr:hypothetical protein [Selenomonadaceae bacterium]MBR1858090.1 hypothetical protein [Selenomonadaceae bacterium]